MQKEIADMEKNLPVSFLDDVILEIEHNISFGKRFTVFVEDMAISAVLTFVALCTIVVISLLTINTI